VSLLRFYIDEDSAERSLISAFRNSGLDVVTVLDVGRQSLSDQEQLIWATEQNRIIYSYNQRDFCRLHSEFLALGKSHAGIILSLQKRYSIGQQLQGLLKLWAEKSAEDMVDQPCRYSQHQLQPRQPQQRQIHRRKSLPDTARIVEASSKLLPLILKALGLRRGKSAKSCNHHSKF